MCHSKCIQGAAAAEAGGGNPGDKNGGPRHRAVTGHYYNTTQRTDRLTTLASTTRPDPTPDAHHWHHRTDTTNSPRWSPPTETSHDTAPQIQNFLHKPTFETTRQESRGAAPPQVRMHESQQYGAGAGAECDEDRARGRAPLAIPGPDGGVTTNDRRRRLRTERRQARR